MADYDKTPDAAVNVNSTEKFLPKLTLRHFRLGQEMKKILLFLYRDKEHIYQQVEIIRAIHGEVTPSRKASVSRSIKALKKDGLVDSRKMYYSNNYNAWIVQHIRFFITEKGEEFVENRLGVGCRG